MYRLSMRSAQLWIIVVGVNTLTHVSGIQQYTCECVVVNVTMGVNVGVKVNVSVSINENVSVSVSVNMGVSVTMNEQLAA